MIEPNAIVDYIDAVTGEVLHSEPFYDPGLDESSWLATELKSRGQWNGPRLSYSCGKPLLGVAA